MFRATLLAIVAVLALQPQDSLAGHISEQQAVAAFQALEARVDALEAPAGGTVVSGFVFVPNGTTVGTLTQVLVVGPNGLTLTDACAGVNNGGWAFSGNTVGDFLRIISDSACTSVSGIALPANEVISCKPLFNDVSFGDTFCSASGLEQ